MSEASDANNPDVSQPTPPEAALASRRRLSVIWMIPIVAAVIAGWLVYRSYAELGPTIEIAFNTADGVEAGKTKVKFKDVDVGTVESVSISDDLSHILLTAEMAKGAENYLRDNTRFWIVRPRIGVGGVTGLGTLISGAYIAIDPGDGEPAYSFTGTEEPPLIGSDVPGTSYVLRAPTLGSIARGAPVYFRGVEVGQVSGYELDEDGRELIVHIFVRAPHDGLVRDNTRFWNASGIRLATSGGGVELEIASLQSILMGGIEFDTPVSALDNQPAEEGHEFALYSSERNVEQTEFARQVPFLTFFDGSLRGLSPGAPVEFRGIRIGSVTDISIRSDLMDGRIQIPVALVLEPDRLIALDETDTDELSDAEIYENMARFVRRGLRAQLETANLLTGDLLVSLEIHNNVPPTELDMNDTYPVIPTVPTDLEALTASLDTVLKQVANLQLDELSTNLNKTVLAIEETYAGPEAREAFTTLETTMSDLQGLIGALRGEVPPLLVELRSAAESASSALSQARSTLVNANGVVSADSPLRYDLAQTLSELRGAARSIRVFADYLERHPDALIRGRGAGAR